MGPKLVAAFVAMDAVFKVLVGFAFLEVMGAHDGPRRAELVATGLSILAPAWLVWLALVWLGTRPIDRCVRDEAAGGASHAVLARAAARCAHLPTILAALWIAEWAGVFAVIIAVDGHGFTTASLLFLAALVLGPYPLAHALSVWIVSPMRGELDLLARERGVHVRLPVTTIRGRLSMYAFCIAVAPSAYMAAIGVSARVGMTSIDTLTYGIVLGFLAVAAFAVLVTFLVAPTLTRPVSEVDEAVQRIGVRGAGQAIARIPLHQRDEIGQLVEHANQMLARLEREAGQRATVERELAIAQQIQTSMLPQRWHVDGLDISASMITATRVGGDYYDILPRADGGWIGIGDVSGHGVSAGLIMLMLQSVTATMVAANPQASTRDLVVAINRILADNIHTRMRGDDFVTFTLLRYDVGGRVRFAGAHEDLVIWRAGARRCERVSTPGPWLGVRRDIDAVTVESELRLEPGDVLVLYTDGVTEARDIRGAQFGIDRLCETIEQHAAASPDAIVTRVVDAVRAWGRVQEDDISVVVARHVGASN